MFRRTQQILALAAAGVVICACFAATAVSFDAVRGYLDGLAGDGSAEPYTPQLHNRLRAYFGCLGGVGLVGVVWFTVDVRRHRAGRSLLARLRDDTSQFLGDAAAFVRRHAVALFTLTLLGLIIRAPYLDQPIRYDEAHSFVNYANRPAYITVSTYKEPNNHVFHNLCVHIVTRFLGGAEWVIRLPAVMAGVLMIPATFLLGFVCGDRAVGWLAALAVASSSPLMEYSVNARGYTLLCLITLCLLLLARYCARRQNRAAWGTMSLLSAVGFWTIPTMLYAYSVVLVWLCLGCALSGSATRPPWRPVFACVVWTIGLTILAYSPILIVEGPAALLSNRFVVAPEWPVFWQRLPETLSATGRLLFRDVPVPGILLMLAGCLLALRPATFCGNLAPSLLLSCGVCGLLVLIQHVLPPPRTWLFLLPVLFTCAIWGLVPSLTSRRRRTRGAILLAIVALLVAGPLIQQSRNDSIRQSKETGNCPDAEPAIVWLKSGLLSREPIVTIVPSSAPLVYYALRHDLSLEHFEWPGGPHTRDDTAIVMVNHAWNPDESAEEVLEALDLDESIGEGRFETVQSFPSAELVRVTRRESSE